tara:strand:+ start:532 stop:924 length:393 start_codon:yes stop_codon:yes gene_type:complete
MKKILSFILILSTFFISSCGSDPFSGTWRYKDTYNNSTLIIKGDSYELRENLMGTVTKNDKGNLERFSTTTKNEWGDKVEIKGIRLLNTTNKPKFWLSPKSGSLSPPWRYIGSTKLRDQSYFSSHRYIKQ